MSDHYRISSAEDAKRLLAREHPKQNPDKQHELHRDQHVPRKQHFGGGDGLHSGGGGSFSVDLAEFETALNKLGRHCDEFARKLDSAADLTGDLPDGSGPVATIVGHAFNHRLGPDGGMHYAVRSNLDQLNSILAGLSETARNYQQGEQLTADQVAAAPEGAA